jgi:glycine/D-amino acid oxidase-like deaminating enzyme
MGHLVVMDDSEAQFALTRYSCELWERLDLPPEVEYERLGTIWVAATAEEMDAVRRKAAYYAGGGVRAEVLDARPLAEAEPGLRPGLAGGLLVPGDAVVYAPCAAQRLLERIEVRFGNAVTRVEAHGVVLDDGTRIPAGIVVCAAGASSTALLPELPLRPRKGHLAITDRYPGFVRHQLVELGYLRSAHGTVSESVAFNVQPRATGQVLVGSSRQYGNTRPEVDSPILGRMLRRAMDFMPGLADLSVIRTWTGFRAATADNLPLIGPCRENVYAATGHEGLGITTSLGTAAILADLIAGRKPAIDPAPYLPSRAGVHA